MDKPIDIEIRLRAVEPEDIEAIYRWENDHEVWQYSAAHTPFSRHQLTQYVMASLEQDIYSTKQLRLIGEVCGSDGYEAVGAVDLYDFDPYHRRAGVGILVDTAWRRRGVGRAMLKALKDYVKDNLDLHQLYCEVGCSNKASLALFMAEGFEVCGTKKQWLHTPQGWEDAWVMQLILTERL